MYNYIMYYLHSKPLCHHKASLFVTHVVAQGLFDRSLICHIFFNILHTILLMIYKNYTLFIYHIL